MTSITHLLYCAFGGIRGCTPLLDEMSDASVISHLERNTVQTLNLRHAACANVVLIEDIILLVKRKYTSLLNFNMTLKHAGLLMKM